MGSGGVAAERPSYRNLGLSAEIRKPTVVRKCCRYINKFQCQYAIYGVGKYPGVVQ
jgi:hypothetical protein